MLSNVRNGRYSQILTALGLLLVLNLNLMGAYGPHKGKDRFIVVGPAAVEMSVSGYGVLALSVNESQEGNDLAAYLGDLSQRIPILENALAFGLGARGYQVGDYLVFCFIYQTILRYLQVANRPATEPQGPPFFMSQVSLDDGFFSSKKYYGYFDSDSLPDYDAGSRSTSVQRLPSPLAPRITRADARHTPEYAGAMTIRPSTEIRRSHCFETDLSAKALGLFSHTVHQFWPQDSLRKARVVLHVGRYRELPARLRTLEN